MYKIDKIILDGYERLQLGQIAHIEIDFNARDQIIIGTNGCGKSSIFYEMSALPADKKNYQKSGRKEIHIRKDGRHIVATSTFDPKPTHSFLLDGVEMNESGLITMQTELCEKYTSITPLTHELMMGKILFTSMGKDERRQWFTKLSDANYEYLIGVYLRFKDEVRDITGALRLAKNKLVAETSKSIKDDELKAIRKEVESLYELIEYLAERRIPIDRDIEDLKYDRGQLLASISNLNESTIKVFNYLGKTTDYDPSTIKVDIDNINSDIRVLKIRESEFFVQHKEQTEIFDVLERTKLESVAKLSSDIDFIRSEIATVKAGKSFQFTSQYPKVSLSILSSITKDLLEISNNIDSNPDKVTYNRTAFEQLKANIEDKTNKLRAIESNITKYESILAHNQEHAHEDDLTCPKCEHSWNRKLDLASKESLELAIKESYLQKAAVADELKILNEDQERYRVYSEYLKSYRAIVSHTGELSDFWNHILSGRILDLKPSVIGSLVSNYESDLKCDIQVESLNNQLAEKLKLLELTSENNHHDYNTVKRNLDELNTKIHGNNIALSTAYNKQGDMVKFNNAILLLDSRKNALQEALNRLDINTSDVMENFRRQAYNAILRNLQSVLASKERILHETVNQLNLIKSLEDEIVSLTAKEKALKVGLKVLSPTEGLIAKGLYGFMQIFIRNMNAVIAKIWSYPLVVKPCNTGDENSIDLSYKFPMVVNGIEGKHKDVGEGSSAMLEVVDIAFRICALKAMKLGETPLFLDEFGKTMDSVHRRATTNLINNLMEEDSFTQMFLISHDISQYGALANCEICVLNDMNVIFPANSVYNKHVTMY